LFAERVAGIPSANNVLDTECDDCSGVDATAEFGDGNGRVKLRGNCRHAVTLERYYR
jgi:hypothetical protein